MSKFSSRRVSGTRGADGGGSNNPGGAGGNTFPNDPSTIGHIFEDRPGHLTDTPAHRAEILSVANDSTCYLGDDRWGNHWFARINDDGTQTWAETRGGIIFEGGRNETPRGYNPETGLNDNPVKE